MEAFEKDMNLMFSNAKTYNVEGSAVYLDADELQVTAKLRQLALINIVAYFLQLLTCTTCHLAPILEFDWQKW